MSDTIKLVLFFIVVLLANIMQTITGFAGTVLAMPFSIILIGSGLSRLILNVLGMLASLGVAIINRKSINWKEAFKICSVMLVGMVVGYIILKCVNISRQILLLILAGFVLLFTFIGIYNTFVKREGLEEDVGDIYLDNMSPVEENKSKKTNKAIYESIILYALLIVAGVIHGMYVCGGPLLIIYATKKLKDKDEFRSTLSFTWVVLNGVNLVRDIISGSFVLINSPTSIVALVGAIIVMLIAIGIGSVLAKKLNKKLFMIITYVLMAVSAVSLILNACGVF